MHARIMMRGGGRGRTMCVVERVHARIMRGEGGGQSFAVGRVHARRKGMKGEDQSNPMCVLERVHARRRRGRRRRGTTNLCSGQGACEEERDEGGGPIKSNVCVGESACEKEEGDDKFM